MQVKDRYLSQIPRNHYKWAGIRESVKPVAKVWFSPIAREKREAQIREHQRRREEEKYHHGELLVQELAREETCQAAPINAACVHKSEFLLYNSKGKGVKYGRPCRLITYC